MAATTSILSISEHPSETLKKQFGIDCEIAHVDTLMVTSETSIGIDMVRDLQDFANHPPLINSKKYIVIPHAETLTPEAQNALLKVLEEPPEYTQFILVAPNTQSFLETVLSRCQIVRDIGESVATETTNQLTELLKLTAPIRLSHLPTLKGKEEYLAFIRQLLSEAESAHNRSVLYYCLEHITKNANPSLALADAVLHLK